MAVTTRDYSISMATPAAAINALETALSDLGWHSAVTNGYVLTFTNTAGTTLAGQANMRYLVKQTSTSGTGTGAVFDVLRSPTGAVLAVTLVTGGSGYAATNTITISGADIGGVVTTDNIVVTVSTIASSAGSTSTFFKKDVTTAPTTAAWGVAKVANNAAKKLGYTFWCFYAAPTTAVQLPVGGAVPTLYIRAFSGFNPTANTAQGVAVLDYVSSNVPNQTVIYNTAIRYASTTNASITLRTRQSAVDTGFSSFAFFEGNNNRNPFFISKYDNSIQPWNLDDVFLGGSYEVFANPTFTTTDAGINNRIRLTNMPKRMAEAGYSSYYQTVAATVAYSNTFFRTSSGSRAEVTPSIVYDDVCFYSRAVNDIQSNVSTQAVFKNIPISASYAPVPYYLPVDFVLIEIPFGFAVVGDTFTVSGGEIYTAIQNASNVASGTTIVMAARTT